MRYQVLACDYDGTIAHDGRVDDATLAALERVKSSGRRLILVSGRELEDLQRIFPRLDLFDRAVLENGALVYDPATRQSRTLAEPPPPEFVAALRARGVGPISVGRVIVATWQPHENTCLDVIRESQLELQVIFNKGAVMILPSGVNKAMGLRAALEELALSSHNVVGVGDAENDHAFLSECELSVAVANALPTLKDRADMVTEGDHGAGVSELCDGLCKTDLREASVRLQRLSVTLGTGDDGEPVTIAPYTDPVLVAGTSGGGKSTLSISLLEQLVERGYQVCIIDPEGDYGAFEGVTALGDPKHEPSVAEVLEVLATPKQNVLVNLLAVPLEERPRFMTALLPRLLEMRAQTGRPHWMLLDETHHLYPRGADQSALPLPEEPHNFVFVTVHPEHVAPALLRTLGRAIAIGATPSETLAEVAQAIGVAPPKIPAAALPPGQGWLWQCRSNKPAIHYTVRPPHQLHQRHLRKYAAGEMISDHWFVFRGRHNKFNLRAQNLMIFLQMADGIDDDTWSFHLAQRDYSKWFKESVKDPELAAVALQIEGDRRLPPRASRAAIRKAIEDKYTAPA